MTMKLHEKIYKKHRKAPVQIKCDPSEERWLETAAPARSAVVAEAVFYFVRSLKMRFETSVKVTRRCRFQGHGWVGGGGWCQRA